MIYIAGPKAREGSLKPYISSINVVTKIILLTKQKRKQMGSINLDMFPSRKETSTEVGAATPDETSSAQPTILTRGRR